MAENKERPKIDPVAKAAKESYYRTRAAGAWPGFQIEGNGEYYLLSRCEGCVYLFARLDDMRAARCGAGPMCQPITHHERGRIKWQPPIKLGGWDE